MQHPACALHGRAHAPPGATPATRRRPSRAQAQNFGCMQMRPYFRRMSTDGPLKAAIFAEIDVEAAEASAGCLRMMLGASRLPLGICTRCEMCHG